ncbi:hypothetical protein [Helicobacter sp. 11S02596-1]|uniref:hypothetical protein n=1 Tax=Helicobacter sp. 11S02596-1 TaxID=1476194 RepID=UPI000BDA67F2|nr:hypothetical protein [Helicobacter sp. 11S02596-1]PAF41783.1 hypothetical protein BJI48_07970 [Helicobacter sp. 11S02596-1]
MIKKFTIFLIFLAPLYAEIPLYKIEGKCTDPKDFSPKQKQVILYAYNYGASKGLGYTMAAIAWKESCAGEYLLNFSDPSAGIYHAHIPGVIKKYSKYKDTSFVRNLVGELLIRDNEFASKVALDTLLFWQKRRNGNYKDMIKSYNKGFSWEKNKRIDKIAEDYYQDVRINVIKLRNFIPKYSKTHNNALKIELENKNQSIKNTIKELQNSNAKSQNPQQGKTNHEKNRQERPFIMPEP